MLTIEQIRAARALLDWSQSDLAERAGLSQTGIARIENGTNKPNSKTLDKIYSAFDIADVEFIDTTGVKKRTGEIKVFKGLNGFSEFMDDVYAVSKEKGGEVDVYNVDEKNWIKWMGEEGYKAHSNRMKSLQDKINFRIVIEEGDNFFIANEFAEYRWFPRELFNKQSFYSYGEKLALINFLENDVQVMVLHNKKFTEGFRVLFDIAWKHVAKAPNK